MLWTIGVSSDVFFWKCHIHWECEWIMKRRCVYTYVYIYVYIYMYVYIYIYISICMYTCTYNHINIRKSSNNVWDLVFIWRNGIMIMDDDGICHGILWKKPFHWVSLLQIGITWVCIRICYGIYTYNVSLYNVYMCTGCTTACITNHNCSGIK